MNPVPDPVRELARTGRLYPAVILYGSTGERRQQAAVALARTLLCELDPPARPCGECRQCRRIVWPAEEAEKFSETVDWTTTLILPIPRYNVQYQYVDVDGVTGTLIQERLSRPDPKYMLIWVKDNIVYVLTGRGDGEVRGIPIADSLK